MIKPKTNKKKASTITMKVIFSVGFIKTSNFQDSVSSSLLVIINNMDLGIIGVHYLIYLVPLTAIATVKLSTKLLDLPMPICAKGTCSA